MIQLLEVPLQRFPGGHQDSVDGVVLERALAVEGQQVLLTLEREDRINLKISLCLSQTATTSFAFTLQQFIFVHYKR